MSSTKWDRYQYGRSPSQGSLGSSASRVRFSEDTPAESAGALNVPTEGGNGHQNNQLRRRRSSLSLHFDTIRHAGGLNSFDNFARSWQRAAGFQEISSNRPSFVRSRGPGEDQGSFARSDEEHGKPQRSLLREQLERHGSPESPIENDEGEGPNPEEVGAPENIRVPSNGRNNLLSGQPHLASSLRGSYASSYGTMSSVRSDSPLRYAGQLWREQQLSDTQESGKEQAPLLVRQIEREDGRIANIVVGQSTLPQTILNCGNTLIGVGILSLPLAIKHAGWFLGMAGLLLSALVTSYTARILSRCMDVDNTVITFGDLAYRAFGSKVRALINPLFCLELLGANVALILLFGDSLNNLIPGLGLVEWKIVCGLILIPMGFLPLRTLSMSSALGLFCCFGIIAIVLADGLIKPHTPGSLRQPAQTHFFPSNWKALPLSFGLLMSPWGGHGVFPTIYRDMRHPHKYQKAVTITYLFTFLMDLSMSVAGLIMFGDGVREEITSNILLTTSYPKALSICMAVFIGIIPLTKAPLNSRPIISTLEIYAGLDPRSVPNNQSMVGMSGLNRGILKFAIRIGANIVFVLIAIAVPSFDRVMGLMGAALCFTICVILPLAFELSIFRNELSLRKKLLNYVLMIICSVMAVIGTVWACLPKDIIGVD
ncbi:MAG: hypothetical protein M1837_001715 [Sclerophora amabilis]|nr:MAG: hypothetical protein M1837_001715 [Sclerophora amabilis]